MPALQPPPFHEDFFDKSGAIAEVWKRFLLKTQSQATIPGNLTVSGAFDAIFTLTGLTSVIFPTSGTLLTSSTAVTNITGTANQIAASSAVGMVTLSLVGPHGFTTLTANGVLYGNGSSPILALALNASATRKFLQQVSSGAPVWASIVAGDLPADVVYTDVANSFTLINPITTIAESWIGPSTTTGIYFKGGFVGFGTITPAQKVHIFGTVNGLVEMRCENSDAASTGALASVKTKADVAQIDLLSYGTGNTTVRWGLTMGGYNEIRNNGGNGLIIGSFGAVPMIFGYNGTERMRFDATGLAIGMTAATALMHLKAGSAAANTAPLKLTSGVLLTTPEAGAIEFLTDAYYGTQTTGPTRKQFAMIDAASIGAPGEIAKIDSTGLTANVAASTLYVVPATGEGFYRVSAYVVETTAGSLSSNLPNVQVVYTDLDSNTVVTLDVTPILGVAGIGQSGALGANAIGTVASGVVPIYVKASTTIQYQTVNYASNLAGMTYALRIRLELL